MDEQIGVRAALHQDTATLVDFNSRMALETEGKRLETKVLFSGVKAVLDDPGLGFYRVAEIKGEIAGSLMVTREWSDWRDGVFWWIQSVYVKRSFRRRGVFQTLYKAVREEADRADQVCGLRLYVERENSVAQATYSRMGMQEASYKIFEELL